MLVLWWMGCTPEFEAPDVCPSEPAPWTRSDPDTSCLADDPLGSWSSAPLPDSSNGWSFEVTSSEPSMAEAMCTLVSDPEEVLTVRSTDTCRHDLTMYGLLADEVYDCVFGTDILRKRVRIETGPLPDGLPDWTTTVTPEAGDDYTLLEHGTGIGSPNRRATLFVVDREGRVRWVYPVPGESGVLDASYLGDDTFLYGRGRDFLPTVQGMSGRVWAQAPASSTGMAYHHHVEPLACGEFATLTEATNRARGAKWTGFAIDVLDPEMDRRTWSWNSQIGVDEGWLPVPEGDDDPYHANALQFEDGSVYVNLYHPGWLVRLDPQTDARVWTLGAGGDFTLLDEAGLPSDDWFLHAHAPEKTGDRILFYDNGPLPPAVGQSRLLELELDEEERTARIVWSYTEPGWFEPIWGDVDRLANGRVLFVRAHCEICNGSPPEARTEIVEVDPATDTVVWRLSFSAPDDTGYRAERIDACTLFSNARHCPG